MEDATRAVAALWGAAKLDAPGALGARPLPGHVVLALSCGIMAWDEDIGTVEWHHGVGCGHWHCRVALRRVRALAR